MTIHKGCILKKILLIYTNNEQSPIPTYPIGLSYVASTLEAEGHSIEVLDLMFSKNCARDIKRAIHSFSPELIGISIRNIDNCCWEDSVFYLDRIKEEIVKSIREATEAPIVAGGSAVNISPKEVKEYIQVDYVITGDGETSFPTFINMLEDSYEPTRLESLECIKRPQISKWTNVQQYVRKGGRYPLQTKRGCSFKCTYCVYPAIEGKSYRRISPIQIADEIEEAKQKGVWQFEITDSVFNVPLDHAKEVCREIAKRNLDISLNTSGINPEFFDEELLRLMEEAGFEEYSFAPDSASAHILKTLGKGFKNKESLINAAKIVKKSHVQVTWWFLLGHPNESKETVEETIEFIKEHVRETDLAFCSVGVRILPGTTLRTIAIEEGQIGEEDSLLKPVFYTPKDITVDEINSLLEKAWEKLPQLMINGKGNRFMAHLSKMIKVWSKHRKPQWHMYTKMRKKSIDRAARKKKVLTGA